MINDKDLSGSLGMVIITNDQWKEFDHDGRIIGVAKVLKLADTMVKIQWTQADNGASLGDVTLYNLSIVENKLQFKIHFDGSNRGYFEVDK